MTIKTRLLGGVSPFAHLNGPVAKPVAASPAEPAPAPPVPGAVVEPPAPAAKTTSKKSETDDDDDEDEDEEGDDESDQDEMRAEKKDEADDDMKKGKKAQHNAIRAARMRERARCAAIFGSEAAGANPALAAEIAFGTHNGRDAAVRILKSAALNGGKAGGLAARMSIVPQPAIDPASGGLAAQGSLAERAVALANQARGRKA